MRPISWRSSDFLHKCMDSIHIKNLRFNGKHGVYEKERHVEQEFLIDIVLFMDTKKAGQSDALSDTVDYQAIKDITAAVVEGESRYLIEKIADEIAVKILEDVRIQRVEVTIQKTAVWENGVPGVTVTRSRITT